MKKYAAFSYPRYYPSGGWGDFIGFVDSEDEALALIDPDPAEGYLDLVSTETWKVEVERRIGDVY